MPFPLRPFHRLPGQSLISAQSMKPTAIALPICLVFISLMVNAAELSEAGTFRPGASTEATAGTTAAPSTATVEPPHASPLDRKSFKTMPFDPAGTGAQAARNYIPQVKGRLLLDMPGDELTASLDHRVDIHGPLR